MSKSQANCKLDQTETFQWCCFPSVRLSLCQLGKNEIKRFEIKASLALDIALASVCYLCANCLVH